MPIYLEAFLWILKENILVSAHIYIYIYIDAQFKLFLNRSQIYRFNMVMEVINQRSMLEGRGRQVLALKYRILSGALAAEVAEL